MKNLLRYLICVTLFFSSFLWEASGNRVSAQNKNIDSLLILLKKDKEDTTKVNRLNALSWEFSSVNPDSAILFGNQALHLSEKIILPNTLIAWQKGIGASYNRIGWGYNKKGDFTIALEFFSKAMDIWDLLKRNSDKDPELIKLKISTMSCMGNIYTQEGNYPKALGYFLEALKMNEKTSNKAGIGTDLGNLGIIYDGEGNYDKALDYYYKALKIEEQLKDPNGIATNLGDIGIIFDKQKKYQEALDCFFKALKISQEQGNKSAEANNLGSIGTVYYGNSDFSKAIEYYLKAVKIDEEIKNKNDLAIIFGNIGSMYTEEAKRTSSKAQQKEGYAKGESYLLKALAMSDSIGDVYGLLEDNRNISELYSLIGNDKKALEHYKKAMIAKDTLFNQDRNKEVTRKEMNYEFDKKESATKAEHDKEMAISDADKKRQKLFLWLIGAVAIAIGIITIIVSRSLRITRKQKDIIEEQKFIVEKQKGLVEEKQKEILDSIHYAKRIQQSLLPNENYIDKTLSRLRKP
jgi:tetratricopeptide (TPR) repeat protein